jgi:type III secretion protein R
MKRCVFLGLLLLPSMAQAQTGNQVANPVVMVIVLGTLALAPFIIIMLTSFVKISVVLSILRNALGTQQVPPNQIITGLAFVLTIFIMVPVGQQMYEEAGAVSNTRDIFSEASIRSLYDASKKAKEPLRRFLSLHSHVKDRELFMDLAVRLERKTLASKQGGTQTQAQRTMPAPKPQPVSDQPQAAGQTATAPVLAASFVQVTPAPTSTAPAQPPSGMQTPAQPTNSTTQTQVQDNVPKPDKDDFQVLIPAFVTSQLKEAFEVGFLLFVPFIVVDMVVANILLAMGMQMLSPTVISLPFKLLLFVLVDGWFLIVRGLVLSYT